MSFHMHVDHEAVADGVCMYRVETLASKAYTHVVCKSLQT